MSRFPHRWCLLSATLAALCHGRHVDAAAAAAAAAFAASFQPSCRAVGRTTTRSLFRRVGPMPSNDSATMALALSSSSADQSLNEEQQQQLAYLKKELMAYLALREEVGADEEAKKEVGKVIGGTKGNVILDYVSGAPNKASVTEAPPNALDYDELVKYGYSHLVKPIMNAGGRLQMYDLLGLAAPAIVSPTPKSAPPIVLDRVGQETRYQGLKLGQAFNDDMQGAALVDYQRKVAQGERPSLSKVLDEVEAFERPFADKRNVGPKQTPDWTADKLDEWGRQQGRVESWARQAKQGAFVGDPLESFDSLQLSQRLYGVGTALLTAAAFGKATPQFVQLLTASSTSTTSFSSETDNVLSILQLPAAALVLASIGSGVYCALLAASKNRSRYVWTVKGLLGGPISVRQLSDLAVLITQQEKDEREKKLKEQNGQQQSSSSSSWYR